MIDDLFYYLNIDYWRPWEFALLFLVIILATVIPVVLILLEKNRLRIERERLQEEERQRRIAEENARNLHVRQKSLCLKALAVLNQKYSFNSVDTEYSKYKACSSKSVYDQLHFWKMFTEFVASRQGELITVYKLIKENQKKYTQYLTEVFLAYDDNSTLSHELYSTYPYFKEYERKIFEGNKLKPIIDVCFIMKKEYWSPKGRNYYRDSMNFNCDSLEKALNQISADEKRKNSRVYQQQHERSKMSNSLRYDILKRDGFRCSICGASASDGAKMHVDHIIPVSKGGRTEPGNLRTLCDKCNFGKRDKYDEHGPN